MFPGAINDEDLSGALLFKFELAVFKCRFQCIFGSSVRHVNSYPANWSVEKAKKESKKSSKNYLGVTDLERIVRGICTKSNTLKQLAQKRARTHCSKALVSSTNH